MWEVTLLQIINCLLTAALLSYPIHDFVVLHVPISRIARSTKQFTTVGGFLLRRDNMHGVMKDDGWNDELLIMSCYIPPSAWKK
mmetsp:Transcript_44891/g.103077  ORF Transcript_44891/g.103077 Transcript_44891/m.103077 type:complete len:84 (-) Transcript_44891:154-405(-)